MTRRLRPTGAWRGVAVLSVWMATTLAAGAQPAARPHLDAAIDAATWIQASRVRTPHGVSWPADPGDPSTKGPSLYSGAPGVVLFLLDLHRATGRDAYLADARAGADDLIAGLDAPGLEPGLYTGLAGLGTTLLEVARATGDAKYREAARGVVARLRARAVTVGTGVEWNDTTDVIGGSAGIGLFLLRAAKDLEAPDAGDLAVRAGRRLLALGIADGAGTKWAMRPDFPRRMPNFSHGTAGIAYFLATLYQATRDRAFLDGALAGATYLKAVARTEGDQCLIFHHEPQEEGRQLFYLGWCHGPAGTARLWYRLWQVTGDAAWLDWMRKSARGVLDSGVPERETPGFWNNVSQCCGSAGLAEFFLHLHTATGDPAYLAYARRVTAHLMAKATRDAAGTRWVQAEHRRQPEVTIAQTGWMQGAAGIGAWLLRLDAFDHGRRPAFVTLPDSPF